MAMRKQGRKQYPSTPKWDYCERQCPLPGKNCGNCKAAKTRKALQREKRDRIAKAQLKLEC